MVSSLSGRKKNLLFFTRSYNLFELVCLLHSSKNKSRSVVHVAISSLRWSVKVVTGMSL